MKVTMRDRLGQRRRPWLNLLSVAVVTMALTLTYGASAAQASAPATYHVSGSVISRMGHVSAELVPLAKAKAAIAKMDGLAIPESSSSCEEEVCIHLFGSGLTVKPWTMTAQPLEPGECTFGTYWAPPSSPIVHGPDLCNESDGPDVYISSLKEVTFSKPVRVCNTAVALAGKACEDVER